MYMELKELFEPIINFIKGLIENAEIKENNIISKIDDNTQIIFRRDKGDYAHPIRSHGYNTPINHYNIEIQKYSEKHHQMQTCRNYHIIVDEKNKIIDIF